MKRLRTWLSTDQENSHVEKNPRAKTYDPTNPKADGTRLNGIRYEINDYSRILVYFTALSLFTNGHPILKGKKQEGLAEKNTNDKFYIFPQTRIISEIDIVYDYLCAYIRKFNSYKASLQQFHDG